jgi:hypothetical protein
MAQFTSEYALSVAKIDPTTMSTFVPQPDSVLRVVKKTPITYGTKHWTRPTSDPDKEVNISNGFVGESKGMGKIVQSLDLACISRRRAIDQVDAAADPANVANHVEAFGPILTAGLEITLVIGCADPVVRGILDYPNGTAGTKDRPEMIAPVTGGNWHTDGVLRQNIIEAIANMVIKGFNGPKCLIVPPLVLPMLADVAAAVPNGQGGWLLSILGIQVCVSPYIDADSTKASFDACIIDMNRVGVGATNLDVTAFHSDEQHADVVDGECWATGFFDPLHDGTEWLKGVCMITANSWAV